MTRRASLWLAPIFLLAAGCGSSPILYSSESAATLAGFTHAEAYRVGLLTDHPGYGGKVDNFAALETAQISPDIAQRAAQIATDPANFRDATQREDFVPSVAWRFYRLLPAGQGQDAVDMLVDFDCDEVMIVARDAHLHEYFRRLVASEPGRQRLLELARDTFPADADLSDIPAIREPLSATSRPAQSSLP